VQWQMRRRCGDGRGVVKVIRLHWQWPCIVVVVGSGWVLVVYFLGLCAVFIVVSSRCCTLVFENARAMLAS